MIIFIATIKSELCGLSDIALCLHLNELAEISQNNHVNITLSLFWRHDQLDIHVCKVLTLFVFKKYHRQVFSILQSISGSGYVIIIKCIKKSLNLEISS